MWLEVLFALGYRPELRGRVDREVEKEIERVRREKGGVGKAKKVS